MHALTVQPGRSDSARFDDVPDPPDSNGAMHVETIAVRICGTDTDIIQGHYGETPPGHDRLILGHEVLGRVTDASSDSPFTPGDPVAEVVFGSVNANRRHYEAAAEALAAADPHWLARLITRRVPLDAWHEALEKDPAEDVKTVIAFGA